MAKTKTRNCDKGKKHNYNEQQETIKDRLLNWINFYSSKEFGIWIECTLCKKWRRSYDYCESHEVPENWNCSLGFSEDGQKLTCDSPPENTDEEYLEYAPGSIVWAKLEGYPWWPGMVDEDPDVEEYFWSDCKGVAFYNVTFLDENVTHAWIPNTSICSFLDPPKRNSERLQAFSFVKLYKGKWPTFRSFDEEEKEKNTLDVTDILLQEVDDLDSIHTFNLGGSESEGTPEKNKTPRIEEKTDCATEIKTPKKGKFTNETNRMKKISLDRKRSTYEPNTVFNDNIKLKSQKECPKLIDNSLNLENDSSEIKGPAKKSSKKRSRSLNFSNKKLRHDFLSSTQKDMPIDDVFDNFDLQANSSNFDSLILNNKKNIVKGLDSVKHSKGTNSSRIIKIIEKGEGNSQISTQLNSSSVPDLKSSTCENNVDYSINQCTGIKNDTNPDNMPEKVLNFITSEINVKTAEISTDLTKNVATEDSVMSVISAQNPLNYKEDKKNAERALSGNHDEKVKQFITNLDECISNVIQMSIGFSEEDSIPLTDTASVQREKSIQISKINQNKKLKTLDKTYSNAIQKQDSVKKNKQTPTVLNKFESKAGSMPFKKKSCQSKEVLFFSNKNNKEITLNESKCLKENRPSGNKIVSNLDGSTVVSAHKKPMKKPSFKAGSVNNNSSSKIKPTFKSFKLPLKEINLNEKKEQAKNTAVKFSLEENKQVLNPLTPVDETDTSLPNKVDSAIPEIKTIDGKQENDEAGLIIQNNIQMNFLDSSNTKEINEINTKELNSKAVIDLESFQNLGSVIANSQEEHDANGKINNSAELNEVLKHPIRTDSKKFIPNPIIEREADEDSYFCISLSDEEVNES